MTETTRNIKSIFDQAIEIDQPEARAAFLDRECGGNLDIRSAVEGLLNAFVAAGSFLEKPVAAELATCEFTAPEEVGATHGPYKLREILGEGGMGSVYLAEQTVPIRRKVAIKVIKPGMDSRQIIARFEAERQALALMEHPNIAKMLDAGMTASGRPYFVMELVKGLPITEHCDVYQLDTTQRLRLFLQVCQAVQHAHQKGIIHRDLKPSNVIVAIHDTTPVVKVIDFGVAKAVGPQLTENSVWTAFSQIIGTPLYMSPEQAGHSSLDVDTRSDIYSLGVLLYELLTSTTPFDKQSLAEVGFEEWRRIIREVEPAKPSARVSTLDAKQRSTLAEVRRIEQRKFVDLLKGELDWIVMKALEKDRNRRYESASAMAADIERFLNNEPVLACPPSVGYRLKKLIRRHKMTTLVLVLIGLGLTSTSILGVMLHYRDQELARRRQIAQDGINQALTEIVQLRTAAGDGEFDSKSLARANELIQRALTIAESESGDPQVLAKIEPFANELQQKQRDRQLCDALRTTWVEMKESTTANTVTFSADEVSRIIAALQAYGLSLDGRDPQQLASQISKTSGEVREHILEALARWRGKLHPPVGLALKKPRNDEPVKIEWVVESLRDQCQIKDAIVGVGEGTAGPLVDVREMSLSEVANLLLGTPGSTVRIEVQSPGATVTRICELRRNETADFLESVIELVDPDPWRRRYRAALKLVNSEEQQQAVLKLAEEVDLDLQPSSKVISLCNVLSANGSQNEPAIRLLRRLQQKHPDDAAANYYLGIRLKNSGSDKMSEAVRFFSAALALNPNSVEIRKQLADCLMKNSDFDEAMSLLQETIRMSPDYATAHNSLGMLFNSLGKLDDAIREYRQAVRMDPQSDVYLANLSNALLRKGLFEEALEFARKAWQLNPNHGRNYVAIGAPLRRMGKIDEAIVEFQKGKRCDPSNPDIRRMLGEALSDNNQFPEAEAEFREAIRLAPDDYRPHDKLAIAYYQHKELDKAITEFREAIKLKSKSAAANLVQLLIVDRKDYTEAINVANQALLDDSTNSLLPGRLGWAYQKTGNYQKSVEHYEVGILRAPHDYMTCVGFAQLLANCPDPTFRDIQRGLKLAKQAYDNIRDPGGHGTSYTLGVALYRAGEWEESIKYLDEYLSLENDSLGGQLFLSMAHWQLGHHEKARDLYKRAVENSHNADSDDDRVRSEAAELLATDIEKGAS